MLVSKKMAVVCIALSSVLALTACHPKIDPTSNLDKELACSELRNKISDIKVVKAKIEDKRGFSGRNIGLAIFFMPGVIVNEVTGHDAEAKADARLVALENIYCAKGCAVQSSKDITLEESKKG